MQLPKRLKWIRSSSKAEMPLALANPHKEKEVALAVATADAESERVRAERKRDAAKLAAQSEIAATNEKSNAQLEFLKQQATLPAPGAFGIGGSLAHSERFVEN
mmetsp:Transcript_26265/g.43867  ORF Transcript_26265/g.43867 Transcript_26265/m.43867 type:complete len:104 (-) Transcript_26265:231-542(-)